MAIRSTSTIVTEPSIEPVTLSDVKAYAKIDGSDDDGLLNDLIMTARQSVEKYLKRALITQTWK